MTLYGRTGWKSQGARDGFVTAVARFRNASACVTMPPMKTSILNRAAAELGRRGGSAGKGAMKRRGGKTRAEQSVYYRALGVKSGKARRTKAGE